MPETPSTMLDLGTPLPSFSLPDFNGRTVSSADFNGSKALVVAFICKHCPFVKHIRQEFSRFAREYEVKGLKVVAIASNDTTEFPEDGPEGMKQEAAEAGYVFPYLFDEKQQVARSIPRRLHAGFVPVRRQRSPRLQGSVRRQPAEERRARHRRRSARRRRCRAGGKTRGGHAEAEHGLQHQMEPRQRAGVLQNVGADPGRPAGLQVFYLPQIFL